MKRYILQFIVALLFLFSQAHDAQAQLPGPGNVDWKEVWVNYQPPSADPSHPNNWMHGNNNYTGVAYDRVNDVLYVVNPGTCDDGSGPYNCPRIFAWNADDGTLDSSIGNRSLSPPGQLDVDKTIVQGGFSKGRYSIYRIDLDDDGRIYAANVVAPLWGVCFPGPPPQCLPEFLAQGPHKVYRWDTHASSPELVYATVGSGPTNTEMIWAMWGTAFDVVSGMRTVNGQQYDSTRIYTSGGKFYIGYVQDNDEIHVIVKDDRPSAVTPFRLGVKLKNNLGVSLAAHGIAAAGPYKNSALWMDSNFLETVRNNQNQDTSAMPQTFQMTVNDPIPYSVTRSSGAIKYFFDSRWQRQYLICADGMPSSTGPGDTNRYTKSRVVDLSTGPNYTNWPPSDTPPVGNRRFNNLTGEDNWISDVDYKVWVDTATGRPYLQVFVLMSNNGIACYRQRIRIPVEMTTFRSILYERSVNLFWQVAAETNNHGFEVHRSFNEGSDWEKIGFVEGRGTTTSAAEYSYSDQLTMIHEAVGIVKYRLRQVDFDGTFEWTDAIDVYIGSRSEQTVLNQNYPNPFNPSTKISYQMQVAGFVTLNVFNTVGDEVASLVQESKDAGLHIEEFDASHLPSGTYMYQLNVNGNMQQKKMVLMK
jgi:type IX secretion system substrate protein